MRRFIVKDKKIGILTLSDPINYGASLQTFALQEYLFNQNYNVNVIDYNSEKGGVKELAIKQKIRSLVWNKTLKKVLKDRKRYELTRQFKKEYIRYSDYKYKNPTDLKEKADYSAMIVGSDQVWNPNFAGYDDIWFLNFNNNPKKISYAASFGVSSLSDRFRESYSKYLNKFKTENISVRETTGSKIVYDLIGTRPKVVLDPVFLLDKEYWIRISVKPKFTKYVLCYYMPGDASAEKEIRRLAKFVSKKHNLKIINIGKRETSRLKFWENNQLGVGPREFLGLFENADCVITNSFHGTAFSVIFNKKFYSVINSSIKKGNLSSRMVDLLKNLGMNEFIDDVVSPKLIEPPFINEENFNKLTSLINESKIFLQECLED